MCLKTVFDYNIKMYSIFVKYLNFQTVKSACLHLFCGQIRYIYTYLYTYIYFIFNISTWLFILKMASDCYYYCTLMHFYRTSYSDTIVCKRTFHLLNARYFFLFSVFFCSLEIFLLHLYVEFVAAQLFCGPVSNYYRQRKSTNKKKIYTTAY